MNKRVLAIAAHPDDIEFVMAGTLLRLRAVGYELHYLNVADGCCGSKTLDRKTAAAVRLAEAQEACRRLGATHHPPLVADLEIFYDRPTLARLTSIVRAIAPEILLTHAPADYMEDHTNTCRLAVSAAFCRGMPNFRVDPPTPPTSDAVTIYHAQPHGNRTPLGEPVYPELYVDISDVIEEKTNMLRAHESQQDWLDASQGLNSYLQTMLDLSGEVATWSGSYAYAEGWRKHLHLGFCPPTADPLASALKEWSFLKSLDVC